MAFRILKVVLLLLIFALLVHRLYYLYFGISNIVTTVIIYLASFICIDTIILLIFRSKWRKNNFRITFFIVLLCLLGAEFTIKYYLRENLTRSEYTFFGNYYSQYRNILNENKIRAKGILDADVGIRLHPPYSEKMVSSGEFSYEHQYNSYGLRSLEWSTKPLETSKVILGIGDSFTEGVGTPQDSTWLTLLESKLNHQGISAFSINGGYAGSDPFFEYYKLKEILLQTFNPEVLVIAINETDITDVLIRGGMERFVNKSTIQYSQPPWWEYVYAFSFITRYIVHDINKMDWFFNTKEEYDSRKLVALQKIYECILQIKVLTSAHGTELIVMYLPMQHEVELNWNTFGEIESKLKSEDVLTLNLLPAFQTLDKENFGSYYWPKDRHINSKGCNFVAEQLANFITANLNLRN